MVGRESKTENSGEPLWTIDDVALYLRMRPETVRMMARTRKVPAIKVGKVWRFRQSEVKALLKRSSNHSANEE